MPTAAPLARVGDAPPPELVEAFGREWVEARARGEFVWPVGAVDERLAARNGYDARPTPTPWSRLALRRAPAAAVPALLRTRTAVHSRRSLSPRGGR